MEIFCDWVMDGTINYFLWFAYNIAVSFVNVVLVRTLSDGV